MALLTATTASTVVIDAKGSGVTALEKVIEIMTHMATKAKEMKKDEAVEYAKFDQFCKDTDRTKKKEISDAATMIESLSAESAKLDTDVETLGTEIGELQNSLTASQDELKKVKVRRENEAAEYEEQLMDLTESVDALERAIAVLQRQNYDRAAASSEALLQVSQDPGVPEKVRRTLAMLMEAQPDDFLNRQAPEAAAYESQTGSIIDLLKRVRDEFAQKKGETKKMDMNSKHAAEMMTQDLRDQIDGATADIVDKTQLKSEKKALSADVKKRLQAITTDHDEAVEYLNDLHVECDEKSKSFKEKQDLRAEEIKAIEKAIEIMKSPEVMGVAEENLPAAAGAALAQLKTGHVSVPGSLMPRVRRSLAVFLAKQGQHLKSARLGALAQKIAAASDPFGKVKLMIEKMIKQLLKEAGEEIEHKGWCDTELGTNKNTRTKLQEDIDGLTARIDEGEATVVEATRRMALLAQEVEELQTSMKQATELRLAEKAKNEETIADAKGAQKAIRTAVAVLKDFYKKASTATALVQVSRQPVKMGTPEWDSLANPNAAPLDQGHREGMQTFGKTYTGLSEEAGGVLALLEVISSDFASLEADTSASEQAAADEHRSFIADSKKSVAVKEKESSMLQTDLTATQADLIVAKKYLGGSQDQLIAANSYYETLVPQCLDHGMTFDEREKARREEIESLQEALRILSGDEMPATQ